MFKEIIILILAIEAATIFARVVFGSARELYKKLGIKIRIHHIYLGLFLIILSFLFFEGVLLVLGASIFLADIIHHFIVLPVWVKRTEFP